MLPYTLSITWKLIWRKTNSGPFEFQIPQQTGFPHTNQLNLLKDREFKSTEKEWPQ
jgi:hypothetical protein